MAAQIKEYTSRVQSPVGDGVSPLRPVTVERGDPYGAAFSNLARQVGGLQQLEEERGRAWAAESLSAARLMWTEELTKRQEAAPAGAPEFTPRVLADFDKHAEKVLEGAPTDSAKFFMRGRLQELRAGVGAQAVTFESKARIDHRKDQFMAGVNNTRRLMNTDPGQYPVALAEQLAILDASDIPPVEKSALKEAAITHISQASVASQIQKSPTKFLTDIGFFGVKDGKLRQSKGPLEERTGNMAFDALPFDKRMSALDTAIKAYNQLEADAERGARGLSEKLGDDALKKAYALRADGQLTRAYVDSIAPLIKPNEYDALLVGLARGPVGHNDREVLSRIQRNIYVDPLGSVQMLHAAYKRGQLMDSTYTAELARAHSLSRQAGPESEYEMSRKYIITSLDPGPYVQDPVGKVRFGEALDAFDRYVKGGKRTDDEIMKRGREIVGQYRFVNLSETIAALPMPRSGRIRRSPADLAGMQADIATAIREAKARRDAKAFTTADYENDMQTIGRWIKAVEEIGRGR